MSSDSEFEPTPPKHRRLVKPLISSSDDSGSPVVRSLRSGRCAKLASDNEDVYVLSDFEVGATSQSGSANSGSQSNSESPSTATIDTSVDKQLSKTSKRSSEPRKNVEKDGAASSSTGVESDSNDSQPEKCPICWLPFTNQEVATPSTCDHRFCFHCLMEWSKTTNTCPVDRQSYNDIHVRPKFGSKVTRLVPVETRVSTDTDVDVYEGELDTDEDDFYTYSSEDDMQPPSEEDYRIEAINESSVESSVITTYSTEEDVDNNSICITLELTSSDENDMEESSNSVVEVASSSDEEVVYSSSSEYNELSSSSSAPSPVSFFSHTSTSSCSSPTSLSSFCSISSSSTSSS